jgi:hypothetical protein
VPDRPGLRALLASRLAALMAASPERGRVVVPLERLRREIGADARYRSAAHFRDRLVAPAAAEAAARVGASARVEAALEDGRPAVEVAWTGAGRREPAPPAPAEDAAGDAAALRADVADLRARVERAEAAAGAARADAAAARAALARLEDLVADAFTMVGKEIDAAAARSAAGRLRRGAAAVRRMLRGWRRA